MKSVITIFFLLLLSLVLYLNYSERFAYMNGIFAQKIGWDTKAAEMFKKGCMQKNLPSCVAAGIAYESGLGVEQNLSIAKSFYEKAARHGFQPAVVKLRRLNHAGTAESSVTSRNPL